MTIVLEILSRAPDLLVMEQSYEADAHRPPPHYHPSQDEHFEVLEGAIALKIGHARSVVPAGESFDIPRGTVHTMGPSGGPARVRWEVRPALRTEQFLTRDAGVVRRAAGLDPAVPGGVPAGGVLGSRRTAGIEEAGPDCPSPRMSAQGRYATLR